MRVAFGHLKEEENERADVADADGEAVSLNLLVHSVGGLLSDSAGSYAMLLASWFSPPSSVSRACHNSVRTSMDSGGTT
ncbi:hypothetical protein QMK17_25370 [Rhodococcus sp. G-MC3]|uniref:hypothetical protein n=1 Tax=Rhodococcus sp. G-MC3 TaxID=3046209 RepID=UPI0024BB1D93|nr:hypothetical protein [Rhodococcus sp. G-MC3]MDJ0396633.1 hypothetical protein [Rhodococcus sp. G-MC3]